MARQLWVVLLGFLAAAVATAGAAVLGYWYGNHTGAASVLVNLQTTTRSGAPVVQVRVAHLHRQRMEETLTAYGTVVAAVGEMQVVSEPYESRILKVLVRAGQTIAVGDSLIEFEPSPDTLLQLSEARDKRDTASGELNLVKQRLELKLATRSELLQAQQSLQAAELRLRSLQQRGIDERRFSMPKRLDLSAGSTCRKGRSSRPERQCWKSLDRTRSTCGLASKAKTWPVSVSVNRCACCPSPHRRTKPSQDRFV